MFKGDFRQKFIPPRLDYAHFMWVYILMCKQTWVKRERDVNRKNNHIERRHKKTQKRPHPTQKTQVWTKRLYHNKYTRPTERLCLLFVHTQNTWSLYLFVYLRIYARIGTYRHSIKAFLKWEIKIAFPFHIFKHVVMTQIALLRNSEPYQIPTFFRHNFQLVTCAFQGYAGFFF